MRKVLIQIRRGAESNIGTLAVGELGYCEDTKKLYIGTATGNALLVAAQSTGDMLKSIYDTNNNGKVDSAETADSVPWTGISTKPTTFAPSTHKSTHAVGGTDVLTPTDIGAMPKGPITWDQLKGV
ncbi:phage tail protein [Paenibacillus sp. 2RAB27]|uniref:hyaluronate lyase N-terminal domain-containing protein n=1 Tax=Paenibacillus sp. 2RAB27 TaxID=3232991 RepID=UPI003F96C647